VNKLKIDEIRKEVLSWDRPHLQELISAAIYKLNLDYNRPVDLELTVILREDKE
jgi:hypothetical protein